MTERDMLHVAERLMQGAIALLAVAFWYAVWRTIRFVIRKGDAVITRGDQKGEGAR